MLHTLLQAASTLSAFQFFLSFCLHYVYFVLPPYRIHSVVKWSQCNELKRNAEHAQIDLFLKTDHSGPVPDFPPDSATLPVNQYHTWASERYHGAPERSQRVSIYSLRIRRI